MQRKKFFLSWTEILELNENGNNKPKNDEFGKDNPNIPNESTQRSVASQDSLKFAVEMVWEEESSFLCDLTRFRFVFTILLLALSLFPPLSLSSALSLSLSSSLSSSSSLSLCLSLYVSLSLTVSSSSSPPLSLSQSLHFYSILFFSRLSLTFTIFLRIN